VGVFHARAIVFDKDGVLVDTMAMIRAAWAEWAVSRGLDADEVLSCIHMTGFELIERFAPSADPATEIQAISAHQATMERAVAVFDGAGELLGRLPAGAWAIVTSARRGPAVRHLRTAGLPVPDVLIAAEDTARGKPDPAGYRLAAARLGVPAQECLAIEDSPAGVSAARAAGMFVLGVTNTYGADELREAHAVITSLTSLDVIADPGQDLGRMSVRWKDRIEDLHDPA
jgi:mannitol-1-/sugar-/sorbitol-6-phosphatase